MCFLYLKKLFKINTKQSTLFSPKTQEFVRAVLIAFGNKNLFPEFLKNKKIISLADGTVAKERLKTPEDNKLLLVTINNFLKKTN